VSAAVLLLALAGALQDPPKVPDGTVIQATNSVLFEEEGAKAMFLTGVVTVRQADFEVRASRMLVWFREGSKVPMDEIYAEGNVIFARGEQKLRAERFYYDLSADKAIILELRGQGTSPELLQPLQVHARMARMSAAGKLEGHGVKLTTCSYAFPHYHVEIGKAELTGDQPKARRSGEFDPFPFRDPVLTIRDVSIAGGNIPFMLLPDVSIGSWIRDIPLRTIQYGNTDRFGQSVLTEWGHRIRLPDEDGLERTWMDAVGRVDWRERRGWAVGLQPEYGWRPAGYSGFLDAYLLWDHGRNLSVPFETKFPPLVRQERAQVHWLHRHEISGSWRFELEAHWLTDRSFREEFFERDFDELKEPETAAYVRFADGPLAATLEGRFRLNDFQTQNEYFPRAEVWLQQAPLAPGVLDGLNVFQRLDAGLFRRRFDDDLVLSPVESFRLDSLTELSLPIDAGPFQLSPFLLGRVGFQDRGLSGAAEQRWLGALGGRFVTQLHGTFPDAVHAGLGLRGIRHVLELELRYAGAFSATRSGALLYPFEEGDEPGLFEEAVVELRQRLLTRDENGKPFEFLSLAVAAEFYPDAGRDGVAPFVAGRLFPFHWITLGPDPRSGTFGTRSWSNLHYDFSLTPKSFFSLRASGEWNPESGEEEVREWELSVAPSDSVRLSGGQTLVRGVTDAWNADLRLKIAEKWELSGGVLFDFRADRFVTQYLVVSRDFHDFILQFIAERDDRRNGETLYVTVVPKFLRVGGSSPARH
jgi:hypothetical protein